MNKWLAFGSIVTIIIITACSGYFYSRYKTYKNLQDSVNFDKKSLNTTSNLNQQYFIDLIGQQIQFGVYPQEEENGVTISSLYGNLKTFTLIENEYFIELSMQNNSSVKINLGKQNTPITHLYGESKESVINEVFAKSTAGDIYDIYKNSVGKPFRVDIYVNNKNPLPEECNEDCQSIYDLYNRYRDSNQSLLNRVLDPGGLKELGAVRLISISK